MARALALDVTRLFIGPLRSSPRGIDRVELGYHAAIFEPWPGPRFGVLPTPWGIRFYDGDRVARGVRALERLWREEGEDRAADPALDAVRRWLGAEPTPFDPSPSRRAARAHPVRGFRDLIRATGFSFGASAGARLPDGALHLNVGQIGLAWPPLTRWLDRRPDIRSVMMLHDVIPLERPDLVDPRYPALHANMVAAVSRRADGLILTSAAAAAAVDRRIEPARRAALRVATVPLPVSDAFRHRVPRPGPGAPYFVVCGAVETRKNHRLLFAVWRNLIARFGAETPRLVIVGSSAWGGEQILAELAGDPVLPSFVAVASGLSTAALVSVMEGAAACLAPSLAEGFGLPVAEALALGVPVIASAIPAHAEVAQGCAVLLAPDDPSAWERALLACADARQDRPPIAAYRASTWDDYGRDVAAFLHSF